MNEQFPFSAPLVTKADPIDGLLQIGDLTRPVPVEITIWDGARQGYIVQLRLDGDLIDVPVVVGDQKPGDTVQLQLSQNLLCESRSYSLSYQATNNINGVTRESPAAALKVDRTKPGATLLAPLIFPTATFGDQLIGLLPGYAGMEPGDVIQTLLNGVEGPAHRVQAEELTLRPVEIAFSREHLQAHAAETVSVEYFATDRAGNVSITSLPTLVSVKL
ncbi:hypothetical protein [Pseudomonas petrae]|uniref:Uncharacterized protein n=1 Tax=Pseudomonas petrae TaxID=2912190 RepID=A0ABS9I393_9PSED|nr:hypothetical protein [Pseudomonas petrae]MCF7534964.1 hypothetical protein [Pseudomonas petrae]MCF7538294.1 hypothetical protein [Pseudomonas petrae]MCF7542214.1 hypothetical protein [Pseudomonas petrae]MCF7555659.1 hypothetical protein [Pseudomonas petrae]